MNYTQRLLNAIPGGAHTYSRGFDQFPQNAPQILKCAKGAYVFDDQDNKFLDYGMALRSVIIGYADDTINQAAIQQINYGNNLTRPSMIELEAAEKLISLINSVEMVKFTKNGSSATTAAVKLARAYTGKNIVLRCQEHPFFSYDDWFIGSTVMNKGVTQGSKQDTLTFEYNNIASLEKLIEQYKNKIACVILEPATFEHPEENFLLQVQQLCNKENIVFILDEMITGFRWHLKGAQHLYGVTPDLCTFGKGMANGFSVAAVGGKKEIMSLGSIEKKGQERVFLLSTTHGAEMSGLGAFVSTLNFLENNNVIEHLWNYGNNLIKELNDISQELNLQEYVYLAGVPCSPHFITLDKMKQPSLELRTILVQEMIKEGVFMPWIALSYAHNQPELEKTKYAFKQALLTYKLALENEVENYLQGDSIKPVFRRFN